MANSLRKCGIGAYADFCMMEHRHMFIDLDLGELLSGMPPEIPARERRILVTQNPRYKKVYKQKLEAWVEKHKLVER